MDEVAADAVDIANSNGGQDWLNAWYPPPDPPSGKAHGAAGVCLAGDQVVLISDDGRRWDLPAGRPELDEGWEDTLRREVMEEACATVTQCELLGFIWSSCVRGPEQGRVLVRSIWRAEVALDPWQPPRPLATAVRDHPPPPRAGNRGTRRADPAACLPIRVPPPLPPNLRRSEPVTAGSSPVGGLDSWPW